MLVTAVGSVDGVENPEGFSGGQDAETDDELRSRLLESYHAISNGSDAAYYRRLALAQDGVASVQVIQAPQRQRQRRPGHCRGGRGGLRRTPSGSWANWWPSGGNWVWMPRSLPPRKAPAR